MCKNVTQLDTWGVIHPTKTKLLTNTKSYQMPEKPLQRHKQTTIAGSYQKVESHTSTSYKSVGHFSLHGVCNTPHVRRRENKPSWA